MSIKNKGGMFKGKTHAEGGIPLVVPETGQSIEVETDEPIVPSEALDNKKVKERKGTNVEILHKINKEVGAKGMNEKATEAHSGDAIICRKSTYDKTKRTYIGTDRQIVSAINQSNGCRLIEKGGKAIEPDGSINQYQKGGNVRWNKKKTHIEELANNMRSLKNNLTRDLKSNDERLFLTVVAILLMMKTGERVGNETSASNGRYGITGLKKKHIKIDGDNVYLNYIGKSGVEHNKRFRDGKLADLLKRAIKKSKCQYVFCTSDGFRIKADKINRYLDDFNVTAKDVRALNSNSWIIEKLSKLDVPETPNKRKLVFNKVVTKVAKKIGHGSATLKKHYMLPELYTKYVNDGEIINVKNATFFNDKNLSAGSSKLEKRLISKMGNTNEITISDLIKITAKEPSYPYEYVGSIKLKKSFLRPYYKLV